MERLLIKDDLWHVISEAAPHPKTDAWKKSDNKTRAVLRISVEPVQLIHIRSATSALGAWKALKNYYQKQSFTSTIFLLKRLCRLRLDEGGDMEKHIFEALELRNSLAAQGEDIKDYLMAAMLLGSLPDSYESLITGIESRKKEEITLDFVKGKLVDEYRRRKGNQASNSSQSESVMKVINKNPAGQRKVFCFFCKKEGHIKTECTKYREWKIKKEKENQSVNAVTEKEEISDAVFLAVNGGKKKTKNLHSWLLDSGATSHMARNRDFFSKIDNTYNSVVYLADGKTTLQVLGKGSGIIKCSSPEGKGISIEVRGVLFVPDLDASVLSVKKLLRDGYDLHMHGSQCNIMKGNTVIATAFAPLFSSELFEVKTVEMACAAAQLEHTDTCQHVWHRRFGHRDIEAIKYLSSNKLANGISVTDCGIRQICDCCVKGKLARKPFPKEATSKSTSILDLVHTDVCSPMPTVTPGKKRFILSMIDDFSRYTKIYLLQYKSEAAACIKNFVQLMKMQLNKKPKIIRSDRGKEYMNKDLCSYLKKEGIRVQYTATYCPQQNGVAERKNRSLLEMTRCMLFDANLNKKYWGEGIFTANFLQNILPTRSRNKTPYELWFKRTPDVSKLHIFGSEVYARVPDQLRKKLDRKANKLIFMGYSEESKAYRLLNKDTERIVISRDVVFLDDFVKNSSAMNSVDVFFENTISQGSDRRCDAQDIPLQENQDFLEVDNDSTSDSEAEHYFDSTNDSEHGEPRRSAR